MSESSEGIPIEVWENKLMQDLIAKQSEQLRDYEAALEFYAMRQEYAQRIEKPARRGGCPIITYPIGLRSDGRIARETLAKWKK